MGGDSIFTPEREKVFPWCKASSKGKQFAFCKVCRTDLNISRGTYAFSNHQSSVKHTKNAWALGSATSSSATIDKLIVKSQQNVDFKNRGIVLHSLDIAHGGAMANSDAYTSKRALYGKMFPDSSLAKDFRCGRTKTTYIIQNCLNLAAKEIILRGIGDKPYGLLLDECSKNGRKKLDFHVSYLDNQFTWQQNCIGSKELNASTDDIEFFLTNTDKSHDIKTYLNKKIQGSSQLVDATVEIINDFGLDASKCIHVQADGCNTMSGKISGFLVQLKSHLPNLTDTETCITHKLNLASKVLFKKGPYLFTDGIAVLEKISSILNKHDKLANIVKQTHNILGYNSLPSYCDTRFLALSLLTETVNDQFIILKKIFLNYSFPKQPKTHKIAEATQHVIDWFDKDTSRIILDQLNIILLPFRICNAKTQKENLLYDEMLDEIFECVSLLLTRIGLASEIDPDKGLSQFYVKSNGKLVPKKFKTPAHYSVFMNVSPSLSSEYNCHGREICEKATEEARELMINELLIYITDLVNNKFAKYCAILHVPIGELVESKQERKVRNLIQCFPLVKENDFIDELTLYTKVDKNCCSTRIIEMDDRLLLKYPNISLLKTCYKLISPSNMSVERGFSLTDWLLPKRRQCMSHCLYNDLKIVISVFPKDCYEDVVLQEWSLIKKYVEKAASSYTMLSKEKKEANEKKKRKQEEMREALHLPPPIQIRKKMKKDDLEEEKKLLQKLNEIQNRRNSDYLSTK